MLEFRINFSEVEKFLDEVDDMLSLGSARASAALTNLAQIMEREMRSYVDQGGTGHKTGGHQWAPTMVDFRKKGHRRPLYHHGDFQASMTAFPLSGEYGVRAGAGDEGAYGTSLAGAARFQFGDDMQYPFMATQSDPDIPGFRGHVMIAPRPYLDLFPEDVDEWWLHVGRELGFT